MFKKRGSSNKLSWILRSLMFHLAWAVECLNCNMIENSNASSNNNNDNNNWKKRKRSRAGFLWPRNLFPASNLDNISTHKPLGPFWAIPSKIPTNGGLVSWRQGPALTWLKSPNGITRLEFPSLSGCSFLNGEPNKRASERVSARATDSLLVRPRVRPLTSRKLNS